MATSARPTAAATSARTTPRRPRSRPRCGTGAAHAVVDIAARYGYTDAQRTEDATDEQAKNITITDGEGGRLTLNSMEAATFYVGTGCYLTAEKKQRARDAAPN
ncbi:hypothetical protein ACWDUN_08325 [Mycobacterium sp. NPDC003323]